MEWDKCWKLLLWESKLPMKIKVFMWLTFQDRLPLGPVLKHRKWRGMVTVWFASAWDNRPHLLLLSIGALTWICAKEALGWDRTPISMQDLLDKWLPLGSQNYSLKLYITSGVLWVLWNIRNKMAIEGTFIRNPSDVFFKIDSTLQRWRVLLRKSD